ncbi:MAG TPA: hypothetical protein VH814_12150 [Steroidobacteraceae bacterium]
MAVALLTSGCDFFKSGTPTRPQGDTGHAATHVRGYGESYLNGGTLSDRFNVIRTTSDGGYIAVGLGSDDGSSVSREYVGNKLVAVRTNADGSVAWQYRFLRQNPSSGFALPARANDLRLTGDGGCVIVGRLGVDALVLKLNRDGSQAWTWQIHPDVLQDLSGLVFAEAFAVDVAEDDSLLVAIGTQDKGILNDDPLIARAFVQSLDSSGRDQERFPREIFAGGWPTAIVATNDGGYVVAGRQYQPNSFDSGLWVARYRDAAELVARGVWLKSYGSGELRGIARDGDGFLLAGVTGSEVERTRRGLIYELTADGTLSAAHEIGASTPSDPTTRLLDVNAVLRTDDGGYLLAGTAEIDPFTLTAWAAKVTRGAGTSSALQWQEHLVGPAWISRGFPGSEATAVDTGVGGGSRIAGRMASYTESSGIGFDSNYGWVLDVRNDGAIDVNPVSGVHVLASAASLVDITSTVSVVEHEPSDDGAHWLHNDAVVSQQPAEMTIETMSGQTGALDPPAIGTNAPGESFYWTGVPEASGFLLFRSQDGVSYTRAVNWFASGIDYGGGFEPGGGAFFKVVAFNARGYSDFSSPVQLGRGSGTTPHNVTLTVIRNGSDGYVTSAPDGIDCGSDCTEDYALSSSGTQVILTAHEEALDGFASWSGCDSVAGPQCTVTLIDQDRSVTANYAPIPR